MQEIKWKLYENNESKTQFLSEGLLDAQYVKRSIETERNREKRLLPNGIELIPNVTEKVGNFLSQQPENSKEKNKKISFSFEKQALPTYFNTKNESEEKNLEKEEEKMLCELEFCEENIKKRPPVSCFSFDDTLFQTKLQRAMDYRMRGNEAFKEDKISKAVALYRKVKVLVVKELRLLRLTGFWLIETGTRMDRATSRMCL